MNMIIEGRYASARVYASEVEQEAIDQIRAMCNQEFTSGSSIRIMPDVHAGKGCTIGTTMTISDKVVPNIVGVDIGCGMYTLRLEASNIDLARLDEAAHGVPSGMHIWPGETERFPLEELRCAGALKNMDRLKRSLGTLGGGNHFIEVDRAADGTLYLVIHTGSRNLGKQVAEHYQDMAIELAREGRYRAQARKALIDRLKAEGRADSIQAELEALDGQRADVPADLCWLYGDALSDYLHDVDICQRFAHRNRELIAQILLERTGLTGADGFHTIHNYIDTGEMILRKGAIAAHKGERVLIPLNMRDGSVLALGRGNPEWNFSAPHGAGRRLSRKNARSMLSMAEYKSAMQGIYTTCVATSTLDESPMAYKAQEDIIGAIRESVDVIDVIKPIYNFKATD
ncbi:MAG: RtcB family protein [Candidatus Fimadaptatus sp.]|jgi:tRNA-splicing ligase RtcB